MRKQDDGEVGFDPADIINVPLQKIRDEAKKGAMKGIDEKIPEIKKQVKAEAERVVTPIVKKGVIASVGLSMMLAIVISKARK
jgi:hypothetical protein